jgi:hypothetical protein
LITTGEFDAPRALAADVGRLVEAAAAPRIGVGRVLVDRLQPHDLRSRGASRVEQALQRRDHRHRVGGRRAGLAERAVGPAEIVLHVDDDDDGLRRIDRTGEIGHDYTPDATACVAAQLAMTASDDATVPKYFL